MPEVVQEAGGGSTASIAYALVAAAPTSRVASDNTIQDVIQVTATSILHGVTYTWFVTPQAWTTDGGPPLIQEKTGQVNAVMDADHVQGFRTVQEQNASRLLVNFAVIAVGTDDGLIYDEVQVEMDKLGTPAVFGAITATWDRLNHIAGGGLA
jgi:hypothetical protein